MFTLGGVRPGNLRAGDAGAGGVGAGFPRPYAGPPPGKGCAPPDPPAGGGMGKPGFPTPLLQQPMFTLAIWVCYNSAHCSINCKRPGIAGGPPAADQMRASGPRSRPIFTVAVHAAPPHTDGMKKGSSCEGAALPDPPTGRGYGETRFPRTPARGLRPPRPSGRRGYGETRFPRTPARGLRPPRPSRGRGRGETRFPRTPARGLRPPRPSRGRGRGETWFPHTPAPAAYVHISRPCGSRRTPTG